MLVERLNSSTNSPPGITGLYMISLNTTLPTGESGWIELATVTVLVPTPLPKRSVALMTRLLVPKATGSTMLQLVGVLQWA